MKYIPVEEKPFYFLTNAIADFLLKIDKDMPITPISVLSLICNFLAVGFIFQDSLILACFAIILGFVFDKLDGSLARKKTELGITVNHKKGTFIDGMFDILGITVITFAVAMKYGVLDEYSLFGMVGAVLYWYTNASCHIVEPTPEGIKHSNQSIPKQLISYSRSKEMIMQVTTIATGQFFLFLLLHVLLIPYSILVFANKVRK